MTRKSEVIGVRVSAETKKRIDNLSKGDSSRLREALEYVVSTSIMFPGVPEDVIMIDRTFWKNQWKYTSKKGISELADNIVSLFIKNPNLNTFDDYMHATETWFKAHGTTLNINHDKYEYRVLIPHNIHKNLSFCLYDLFKQISIKTNKKIQEYKIADDYVSLTFETDILQE